MVDEDFKPAPIKPTISFADADRIDVRVGTILSVEDIAGSDKLLKLTVDFGDHRRCILAGMKKERENPHEIEGTQTLFVVNLEPKKMMGELSEGMLFDLGYADGIAPALAIPEKKGSERNESRMRAEGTTILENTIAREEEFQLATYKKMPVVAERGEGVWIFASNGDRYLDLYGGHAVAATGHCHPHVVAAIREQSAKLLFYSNLVYSEARARAAEKLVSIAPASLTKAFFCNSGTEANENAMRMARMATRRTNIVTFSGGFHGRTADAISATFLGKYREVGKPNVPGHLRAEFGDIESMRALADDSVAAIMLEPIQSMAGVRMARSEFYRALRELCDERGIVLIYDEVQTGIGRTGDWFFAEGEAGDGVVPDIITLAKALGSGIPVGACLVTGKIASHIKENDLGTTFGGGMIAMAAVTATLESIENDGMLANVREVESHLRERLKEIEEVVAVHGRGFLLGLEFADKAKPVHEALLARQIITGTSSDAKVLRLLPPLCLGKEEVDLFVEALRDVL